MSTWDREENWKQPLYCDDGRVWQVLEVGVLGHFGRVRHGLRLYRRAGFMEVQEVERQMYRSFLMLFPDSAFFTGQFPLSSDRPFLQATRDWVQEYVNTHAEPVGWSFCDRPLPIEYRHRDCTAYRNEHYRPVFYRAQSLSAAPLLRS